MNSGDGHSHDHTEASKRGLIAAAGLNTIFAFIQVTVGIAVGSIVVLADAAHQVVDALGLLTAMFAIILMARPSNTSMSFGWGKADALGGFVSGLLLLGSVVWIAYESIRRLLDPTEVDSAGVILIGLAGLAVNGISVLMLGGGQHILAVRAARLHLLTDLAGSALVVLTGLLLSGTSLTWLDPAASLLLCFVVIRSTWYLLHGAIAELLDRAPSAVSAEAVAQILRSQPGVLDVHHIHVRPLGQSRTSVTAHVVVDGTQSLHDARQRTKELSEVLSDDLRVDHSTLQLECVHSADNECGPDGCVVTG